MMRKQEKKYSDENMNGQRLKDAINISVLWMPAIIKELGRGGDSSSIYMYTICLPV